MQDQKIDLQNDIEFYQFMNKDVQRQQHYQDLWELRMKTARFYLAAKKVFPAVILLRPCEVITLPYLEPKQPSNPTT